MIKIFKKELVLHETPLEKIYTDKSEFILEVDDIKCRRVKISFKNYHAVKYIPIDTISYLDYMSSDFQNGEFLTVILEKMNSEWIDELSQKSLLNSMSRLFVKNIPHHYIVFVGDFLLEIIADECYVTNL